LRRHWHWRAIAVGAAAVLALGACGGDDDDSGTGSGTGSGSGTEATDDTGDGGGEADAAAFCAAMPEADRAVNAISEGGSAEDAEAAIAAAEEAAPEEISDAVAGMAEEGRAQIAAGPPPEDGPPNIPSDEFFEAATEVGDYLAENCDFQVIDVTATNYAFDGIPEEAEAGATLIRLQNDGTEYHEVALQRLVEGETRTLDELLALPEEEVGAAIAGEVGFVFAPPGLGSWTVVDLEAGRNVALCFIPVGATPEALQGGTLDETAPPHAMEGMVAETQVS
jgi:hypothetical protein